MIGAKPLCIMFDKVDKFIRDYNGTKYLLSLGSEKYNAIFNRIRYLIMLKSNISYVVSHNYGKIKVDSDDEGYSKIMLRFGKTKVAKQEFYGAKNKK